jgi:hypothetical protein
MELELSSEDRELLVRIVEKTVGDLRVEVRRTREPAFHDRLVGEEDRLKALLERLRALGEG